MKSRRVHPGVPTLLFLLVAGWQISCGDDETGSASATGGAGGSSSGGAAGADSGGAAGAQQLPTCAGSSNPALAHAPGELVAGVTQAEWGIRWYQWSLGLPKTDHPNLDGPCEQGQKDPIWFLGSARPGSETRDCTLPSGVEGLVVPVSMVSVGATEEDYTCQCGQCPCPVETWQKMCKDSLDALVDPNNICVEVDGVSVGKLDQFYFETGLFRAHLHDSDPYQDANKAGTYPPNPVCDGGDQCEEGEDRHFYRCGYQVIVKKPSSPGNHKLRYFMINPPDPTTQLSDFREVTYDLNLLDADAGADAQGDAGADAPADAPDGE